MNPDPNYYPHTAALISLTNDLPPSQMCRAFEDFLRNTGIAGVITKRKKADVIVLFPCLEKIDELEIENCGFVKSVKWGEEEL